ncbi:MAG: zinc ribbon domain-containing protein [Candidatus Hodarchaeota archaeon]
MKIGLHQQQIYNIHFLLGYKIKRKKVIITASRHYQRHYHKRDYEGNLSGFAVGIVFCFVGILSLVLNNLDVDFISISTWGYWLFIPAFFILLGSTGQYFTDKRIKRDVLAAIQSRSNGSYNLDEVAADSGVKRKDLLRVLMDIRSEGLIKYSYNESSGEIIVGEQVQYEPAPEFKPLPKRSPPPEPEELSEKNFCLFCGHKLREGAKFCPNCGSSL